MMILFVLSFMFGDNSPMGQISQLFAFRQFAPAKEILDQIIEQEGDNADAMKYRLRAECYANMEMPNEALEDIEIGLKKDPNEQEYKNLYALSAMAHITLGMGDEAVADATLSGHAEITQRAKDLQKVLGEIDELYDDEKYSEAAKVIDRVLPATPKAYHLIKKRLEIAWNRSESKVFEDLSKKIIDEYPEDTELHFRRGISQVCNLNFNSGKQTLVKCREMEDAPRNISDYIIMGTEAQNLIKRATRHTTRDEFEEANETLIKLYDFVAPMCGLNTGIVAKAKYLQAKLAQKQNRTKEAIAYMDEACQIDDKHDYLLFRADLNLKEGDFEAAMFDYKRVQSDDPRNVKANQGLQKANEMKKKANAVNLYSILGLDKSATNKQIKDAYRKLTVKWHPDHFASNKEKKREAELKMKDINKAYDVLSDPKKKKWYDNGGDMEQYNPNMADMQGMNMNMNGEGIDPILLLQKMFGGGAAGGAGGGEGQQQFVIRFG